MIHVFAEALKGMEAVAEHINEMQKIYEEYGSVFNDLTQRYREVHPNKPVSLLYIALSIFSSSLHVSKTNLTFS